MPRFSSKTIDAVSFAIAAHGEQKRKYTNEPYVYHPIMVAEILCFYVDDVSEEMIVAAVLHDVVEDTANTLDDISKAFGSKVSELVYWLTDVSKPNDGNRKVRKQIDCQHTSNAPHDAQLIKLADLIDNSRSIIEHDKGFAKVYIAEKRNLLNSMREDVKKTAIFKKAESICGQAELELSNG